MTAWSSGPATPIANSRAGAVAVKNTPYVYVVGGANNAGNNFDRCDRLDVDAGTWAAMASLPSARGYCGVTADSQGRLYSIGGNIGTGGASQANAAVYRSDSAVTTWNSLPSLPSPRYGSGVAADSQDRIYCIGGVDGSGQVANTLYCLASGGSSWSALATMPTPLAYPVAAYDGNRYIYAWGGFNGADQAVLYRYDITGNAWATLASMAAARFGHCGGIDAQGRLYAFGGRYDRTSADTATAERFDPIAGAWAALTPNMPATRRWPIGAVDKYGRLYVIGGDDSSGNTQSTVYRDTENTAPTAAAPTTPAAGSTVDRTLPITLAWVFNDPDTGDSQSKADIRYRLTSASTWTTILGATTTATSYALPANQTAGNYEWQVLTYDSQGVASPWSSSSFFTAADPPGIPVITAPSSGGTIATASYTVNWSSPTQEAYEVRRVADNAGSPNTGTVYFTTGTVVDGSSRARTLTFDTNNRTEHVQVRVRYSGIWSQWADARVLVSYTPPATPVVTLTVQDATASILVTITNPTPSGSQPTVASHDILIDDGFGEGLTRRVTGWAPGAAWTYWLPVSGRPYEGNIRVVAVATNNTTSTGIAT